MNQAAAALQAKSKADSAAGNNQEAYFESIGQQLVADILKQPQGSRGPAARTLTVGAYQANVMATGDANDAHGLAGFSYTLAGAGLAN